MSTVLHMPELRESSHEKRKSNKGSRISVHSRSFFIVAVFIPLTRSLLPDSLGTRKKKNESRLLPGRQRYWVLA